MAFGCRRLIPKINSKLYNFVICAFLPFVLLPLAYSPHKESRCGYVMLLMAGYWLLEPVPLAVTALIPVILFPLLGVVSSAEICHNYMKESFMMFIGGLIVTVAVEDCNLHERIALKALLLVGTEIQWLLMGFMLTTMFLAMWISNTATTAMMVPLVEAVIEEISRSDDIEMEDKDNYSQTESKQVKDPEVERESFQKTKPLLTSSSPIKVCLMLSICYAANIGGTGTLTGSGPNLVMKGLMEELYPESEEITFATWMMYNVPGMLICILTGWFYLWMIYIKCSSKSHLLQCKESIKTIISKRYAALGSISAHEAQVLVLFLIQMLLWMFREPKFIVGWEEAIGSDTNIGDSVPGIGIALFLFFLPAKPGDLGGRPILEWKTAQAKLPWGILILIGGGFALADAAHKSGLSHLLSTKLAALSVLSPEAIATVVCFMTAMLTEIMTNATAATILLPVFSELAVSIGLNPLFLMIPVTVVCSYAFMLPVACPSNSIVFERGSLTIIEMAKPGIVMNLVCCAVQLLMINTLGVSIFDLHTFPSWADSIVASESLNITLLENSTLT